MTTTMKLPGLDLTLLEAIQHNETQNAQHPIFRYANEDGSLQTIMWSEAGTAFARAGHFILESVSTASNAQAEPASPRLIGMLANLDSITFFAMTIGIMKAGFVPFLISTRNSPEAIAHLMASTGCQVVLISEDKVITDLAGAAIKILETPSVPGDAEGPKKIQTIVAPTFKQLYGGEDVTWAKEDALPALEVGPKKWDRLCVVIHSSGTTSFPKPVSLTHSLIQRNSSRNRYDDDNYIGCTIACHGIPMFHLMGFTMVGWSAMLGVTLTFFPPRNPPILPAPGLLLQSAIVSKSNVLLCTPAFLETWSTDQTSVELLKTFRSIIFGGGPIREDIGEVLVQQGVKVSTILGLSELGCITTIVPKYIGPEISPSWLEADPELDIVFIPEDEDKLQGVYRIAVKENDMRKPAIFNTTIDGVPAFDTKDLVIFHPNHPKYFKVVGRADDQITHSTGEKTNPGPIEMILLKSPYIAESLVFGRARLQTGVLIKPARNHEFDIRDHKRYDAYLDLIWDAITEANSSSSQHSRIFREMILILGSEQHFEHTPKGTIRREMTLRKYADDINQLYEVTEGSDASEIGQLASLNLGDVVAFVHAVIRKVLNKDIKNDDDIFWAGADSLCALSIRLSVMRGLHGLVGRAKADTLPRDVVYMYPTISALAAYISNPFLRQQILTHDSDALKLLEDDQRWENILKSNVDNTVVKITPGNGETPLILIHGGGGAIVNFRPFINSKSAVWALQMTDDLPTNSVETVCAFYYAKIKEQQPCGPYSLAAYSGSCVWVVELVRLFESNGDEVKQLAIIDHCPALFFPNFDPNVVQVDNEEWMAEFVRQSRISIANLFTPTVMNHPRLLSNAVLLKRMEGIKASVNSNVIPDYLQRFVRNLKAIQETSIRFMMKPMFLSRDEDGVDVWSSEQFRQFTAQLKAPVTIYVATYGVNAQLPPGTDVGRVRDLGASMVFDKYSVVSIPGDHIGCLEEEELHQRLLA